MKKILLFLIVLPGCALYHEGFSPALKDVPKQTQPLSKPWMSDISIPSLDSKAMLLISHNPAVVSVRLNSGVMRYRLGHSVEIQRDDNALEIFQVEPTDNALVSFSDAEKLLHVLQGSRQVRVELFVQGSGLQNFIFSSLPLVK
jgi:hypothetical protein